MLWLLVANVILNNYNKNLKNLRAFCDDYNMIVAANIRRELERQYNAMVNLFLENCKNLKLKLSVDITVYIMFGKNILKHRQPAIKLGTTPIKQVESINILRILFGQNLTW